MAPRHRQGWHEAVHRSGGGGLDQADRCPKVAGTRPSSNAEAGAQLAPEFALSALDGRRVRLSDFRGKVVLLNFWATWCAPCRVEMPWLAGFDERYRSSGLRILGVAVDDGDPGSVARFVRERNVNYTILLKDDAVTGAYGGARQVPQTFLIDRSGRIIAHTRGINTKDDMEAVIRTGLGLPRANP